jgi:NAD(P)-dependent dehydrogenase (short-subunit alcohol dehydrogenase family)
MTQSRTPLEGKVCLVTGATAGIGEATAHLLAELGATVVVHGRDPARTERVVNTIKTATGNPRVDFLVADMASQQQIRRLAADFKARYSRLDILLNNAGGQYRERQETPEGLEATFAVNHLGYFLLTNLLRDVLLESAPSRIVSVASGAHQRATLDFADLQATGNYDMDLAYARSKLANILFTYELARRLESTGVTANCLAPGLVMTEFGFKNGQDGVAWRQMVEERHGRSPADAAQWVVYVATAPELAGVTGKYFRDGQQIASSPASYDELAALRLWEISKRLTGLQVAPR